MKNFILLLTLSMFLIHCQSTQENKITEDSSSEKGEASQLLLGAWESSFQTDSGTVVKLVATITEGFLSETRYIENPPYFIRTRGGSWQYKKGMLSLQFEWDSADSTAVGSTINAGIEVSSDQVTLDNMVWKRIDDGTPGDLVGSWLITGRRRNGELRRSTPGTRKTMKILSGTRFQWIAYDTGNGGFYGTGGGTYTTIEGKYVENIEFFSRDNSRAGATLDFDYKLENNEWYHSGLSSKGEPLMEIWTPRHMVDSIQ